MTAAAYGYARVSTAKQDMSIEAQKQQVEGYYGWKLKPQGVIWGGFFSDAAVSGNRQFRERAAGKALWDRLGPGDHVIVAKQDRAFRNSADHFNCLEAWRNRGIKVHVMDIGVDSDTPVGELLMGILAQVAQFERSRLIERCKTIYSVKRALGIAASNVPPVGFRFVRGPDKHRHPEWCEPEVRLMRRLYEDFHHRHQTFQQIADALNSEGVASIRKGRRLGQWSPQRVHRYVKIFRGYIQRPDFPEYGKPGSSA